MSTTGDDAYSSDDTIAFGHGSRRQFIQATGAFAGALTVPGLLAACSSDDGDTGTDSGASPAPTGGNALGGGTVRFWSVVQGPEDEAFQRAKFDEFMQANPDVEVEPQFFPTTQWAEAMQLAFTGGDAPDVFRQSGGQGLDLNGSYARGWVRPVDEFLTDEFKQRFPDWVYDPEQSPLYIDGEAYGVPLADPAVNGVRLLLYNVDVLDDFGFDQPPATWSQMREMVATITRDGGGSVYGTAPSAWNPTYLGLQALAGPEPYENAAAAPISLLTGEPAMSEPSLIEMVEFLQGMQAEELYTPGWESWEGHQQYLEQMAAGRLGMYVFPLFHVAELRRTNPDLNLGIAPIPVPDTGRGGSMHPQEAVNPWWMMSSEVRNPEAAWRLMDFLGSVEFQLPAFEEQKFIPLLPAVWEEAEVDDDTRRIREIAADTVRVRPRPQSQHPGAVQFHSDLVANGPRPTPVERYTEALSRGSDFTAIAAEYDEALAAVIEEQLASSDVTMDAFTFPDWDPLEDYGA